jgi:hypothetical protein
MKSWLLWEPRVYCVRMINLCPTAYSGIRAYDNPKQLSLYWCDYRARGRSTPRVATPHVVEANQEHYFTL